MKDTSPGGECAPAALNALPAEHAERGAALLKALADPLRLRIVSAIAADPRGECCACDFAPLAPVSQPTLSHHLKVLKSAGVLNSERRGTWIHYRLAPDNDDAVRSLLTLMSEAAG